MDINTITTPIKIIAFIIFVIACVAIYHNTNSFEPAKRIGYIIVGTFIMYLISIAISGLNTADITVTNQSAIHDVKIVIETIAKFIFTPINAMLVLSVLGNTFGKVKDRVIRNR